MMVEFPSEIVYDILSRMPVKSLGRFQCVSKQWHDYINYSYLGIMHARRGVKDPAMLIMFQKRPSEYTKNLSILNVLESKKEEAAPFMKFLCSMEFDVNLKQDKLLGCCKGLLFSSLYHIGCTVLVVIHPLRKQSYELPPIRQIWSYESKWSCGLGFDDSTNTFKMVFVLFRKRAVRPRDFDLVNKDLCTMVHVLGSDQDSWVEIPRVPLYPIQGEGVYVDGFLYWLVYGDNYIPMNKGRELVCFDVKKEEFGLIKSPKESQMLVDEKLLDLDGRLGFVYYGIRPDNLVEVWLLTGTKWILHCRVQKKAPLPTCPKVLGLWNKEGDLLLADSQPIKLFVYGLKSGVVREAFVDREYGYKGDVRLYQSSWLSIPNSDKICLF